MLPRSNLFGGLYLGCPQWHQRQWTQSIFPVECTPKEALRCYARVFNAVEGNTTFYATPPKNVIERWASETPHSLRMVLKFPQEVTHERSLDLGAIDIALRFVDHMTPLGSRRSYTLIQLPSRFDERSFDCLYRFLQALPRECSSGASLHYAVELRAPSLSTPSPDHYGLFEEVNDLLSATRTERVWMDTRALREASEPWDEPTRIAMERKPKLPVYPIGLGPAPMIRFVAHPQLSANSPWLKEWAQVFSHWLSEGRHPFFFAHYPGETLAPQVASLFYHHLRELNPSYPERPIWPSERQLTLF